MAAERDAAKAYAYAKRIEHENDLLRERMCAWKAAAEAWERYEGDFIYLRFDAMRPMRLTAAARALEGE